MKQRNSTQFYLRTAVAWLVAYLTFMFVFVYKLSTDTIFSDMLVTTLVFAFLFYNPGIFRPTLIIEDETVVVKKRSGEVSIPFSNLKNVEVKHSIWGRMMKFYYEGGKVVTYPKDVEAAVSYLRQLGVTCIKESWCFLQRHHAFPTTSCFFEGYESNHRC